jgi:DNA-binding FadR family transcriptional regulator
VARTDGQVGLLNERTEEITDALNAGDTNAADAAANAYGNQVDQAISSTDQGPSGDPASNGTAQQIAALQQLRTTLSRQLAHFQSMTKPTDKSTANLEKLIAKTQAAIASIDAQLATLGS